MSAWPCFPHSWAWRALASLHQGGCGGKEDVAKMVAGEGHSHSLAVPPVTRVRENGRMGSLDKV